MTGLEFTGARQPRPYHPDHERGNFPLGIRRLAEHSCASKILHKNSNNLNSDSWILDSDLFSRLTSAVCLDHVV